MGFDAAILDVDGVLTRTADVHERTWREVLEEVLRRHGDARPFTREDYLSFLDGKPRLDGLRAFLAARGLALSDAELHAVSERKNALFQRRLETEGVELFDDAVRQVRAWRGHGLGVGFVSASRNAGRVLQAAGIADLCDVRVDGEVAAAEGLEGKRGLLREAARRLGVEPPLALVVEDAEAGLEAAAEVGFGLVVGVARDGDGRRLEAHGADRVVRALDELADTVEPGTRRACDLPSALEPGALEARVGERRPAVFLDFDGTLSEIVRFPDQATITEAMRAAVAAVARRCPVAIVSGRDRADLARRVGLEGLWYVGSHGFEVQAPDGRTSVIEEARPAADELRALEPRLRAEVGALPGVVIEPKAFAVAVHYRAASDDDAERVIRVVRRLADESRHLRAHAGKRVIELRPRLDWHKGRSVERLLDRWGVGAAAEPLDDDGQGWLPIYVGDDHTDEDAFRALEGCGLGVLVGAPTRPTRAHLRLDGTADVQRLLAQLARWLDRPHVTAWSLSYEGWEPERERLREALCTLGNGNFATRGAAEESRADPIHYPGTYLAGGYDRIATEVRGEVLVNEDLVNWPNWLPLSFRPEGGEWLSLEHMEVLELEQRLDLRRGVLRRRLRVRDAHGRETTLSSRRIVSMHAPWVAALEWSLVAENWSGRVELRSGLDGTVENAGVARYAALRGQHLVPAGVGRTDDGAVWLAARARRSGITMAQVARTRVRGAAASAPRVLEYDDRIDQVWQLELRQGRPLEVEKVVVVQTSRDPAVADPVAAAQARLPHTPGFERLVRDHARTWSLLWRRCDIQLEGGDDEAQRILRLHLFHLLQVASPHVIDRDVGVPARGLHGEAYRGHVFWDELFIFPLLTYCLPALTRELLMYRYRRLDAARRIARALGLEGAAYPWQSGSDGREESQVLHLNPRSGRWIPDETHRQRHIGAAVAWNVWQYYQVTGDREFLAFYGAEMLVEIARFWASLAAWDAALQRYRIRGVVGPDEFHTRYPGSDRSGVDDNAYTNVMAAWCLRTAEQALTELPDDRRCELLQLLAVGADERRRWRDVATRLRVPFAGRIISQFDGYERLEELDWEAMRARHGDIQRLDRILEAAGDDPNRYKASKQADVLMLFFLFEGEELASLLRGMGYEFDPAWIRENIDHYLARTSHGSTLSRVVHSWVLARSDRARSWELFQGALLSDVADTQGGTTSEGIHLGAMAGTVDLVKRGYTGAAIREGVLWLAPRLPDELPGLRTRFRVRGAWLDVRVTHDAVEVEMTSGHAPTAHVGVGGRVHELRVGERRRFPIEPRRERRSSCSRT